MYVIYGKHLLIWIAFSFLYLKGLSTAVVMSIDTQNDPTLLLTIAYSSVFILLSAHLINKYEKRLPLVASIVISGMAVVPFGHFATVLLEPYTFELNLALFLALPFYTWAIKRVIATQTP
ncbi:hypothetical protein PALB_29580 [Pseudoalteromonas luteoviolacea B = ATCC 29581]|nr:hypothetical protein PALB_29580 [Pseudoalteromonas luteoviolacea B = ATCC 29581]